MRFERRVATSVWIAPLAVLIGTVVLLVGFVPYSEGYGWRPVSLGTMLRTLWMSPDMEDWQHGALVPLLCLGLLYYDRRRILSVKVCPADSGLAIVLVALLLYYAGRKAGIHYIGFFSLQLLLAGMVVWMFGWGMMRAVLFPWMFLAFAWPLPFLTDRIAVPLRHIMAVVSADFLNLIGIPTLRVGTSLRSAADAAAGLAPGERFALDVANPCSGIRSLFALLMVSALYGYLTFRETWKRVALVIIAMPLAVFGNLVRMIMLTLGSLWFGTRFAIGTMEMTAAGPVEDPSAYHMAAGFAVFAAALAGMLGVAWLLNRDWATWARDLLKRDPAAAAPAPTGAADGAGPRRPGARGEDPY